ncbi:MAG: TetR family transcriptional regulator [Clostridia bacterium]|nr:TetR family transcriptional regulator [Clostridia bacterium]
MTARGSAKMRTEEILNACERLYARMSFKEVTIKEIGAETSFSRPSIYNYFQTKEEIFLALFEREYLLWGDELEGILCSLPAPSLIPARIAETLEKRELMLKLLAMNLYDMEENSRIERLVSFKQAYGRSVSVFDAIIKSAFPAMTDDERRRMLLSAFEFMHGVYPYARATAKQIEAMAKAGVRYDKKSLYELALDGLQRIIKL